MVERFFTFDLSSILVASLSSRANLVNGPSGVPTPRGRGGSGLLYRRVTAIRTFSPQKARADKGGPADQSFTPSWRAWASMVAWASERNYDTGQGRLRYNMPVLASGDRVIP